jgi:hypothetical protein
MAVLTLSLVAVAGCATAGSGGGDSPIYRYDVGRATPIDLGRYAPEILGRYQYELERQEQTDFQAVFETRWTGRFPTPDESTAGIEEIRMRITIRAGAMQIGTGLSRVELVGENMVRYAGQTAWVQAAVLDESRNRFQRVGRALKTELETGIRVRG